jgi:hypothetical protein
VARVGGHGRKALAAIAEFEKDVFQNDGSQAVPPPGLRGIGDQGHVPHVLRPRGDHDLGVAGLDGPVAQAHPRHGGAAGPVDGQGDVAFRKTGQERDLPGRNVRVNGVFGGNAGPVIHLVHLGRIETDTADDFLEHLDPQVDAQNGAQNAVEPPEGRPNRADNNNVVGLHGSCHSFL